MSINKPHCLLMCTNQFEKEFKNKQRHTWIYFPLLPPPATITIIIISCFGVNRTRQMDGWIDGLPFTESGRYRQVGQQLAALSVLTSSTLYNYNAQVFTLLLFQTPPGRVLHNWNIMDIQIFIYAAIAKKKEYIQVEQQATRCHVRRRRRSISSGKLSTLYGPLHLYNASKLPFHPHIIIIGRIPVINYGIQDLLHGLTSN